MNKLNNSRDFQFNSEVFIFFYTHLHIYRYVVFHPFGYGELTNTTHITDNTKHPTLTQTQIITIFSPYYLHIKQSQNIANSKSLISLTRKSKQPTQVHAHGLPHTFTFDKRTYSFTQHTSVKMASHACYNTRRLSVRIVKLSFLLINILIFVILQLLHHVLPVAFPAPPAIRVLFTPETWTPKYIQYIMICNLIKQLRLIFLFKR